ncbi:ferritin heavy chain B isoform X2 [Rhagoletis pomonella]|uniref:ferritin heavy chain B isoform X2 n=1 Tax=Rhagoletis pomonella TaxID=28610 RepID=UPI00177B92DC|nr:ferritin heavy chain B isoform X2 [Rhagoletis pomonella]
MQLFKVCTTTQTPKNILNFTSNPIGAMNFAGRLQFRRLLGLIVRQNFNRECENAINAQIQLELKSSYDYLAMAYHFDRCDMALPGIYGFFKAASDEEREHAAKFMEYMNKRGGTILLQDLPAPQFKFTTLKAALEEALDMEKTVNESLLALHALASKHIDPQLCDFLETHFLAEQVDAQKQLADYIRQIERCEKELGVHIFDKDIKGKEMH